MEENWSDDYSQLQRDLLELIAGRLDSVCDLSRFGAVCTSWRSVVVDIGFRHLPPNQFPGLMVPGFSSDSETRRFLQLNYKTGLFEELANDEYGKKLSLLVPHRHLCRGTSYGWIFITDDDLNTRLLNPFTGAELQLPSIKTLPPASKYYIDHQKWTIFKAVISTNPSHQPRPTVLIIHGGNKPRLAFSEPGDSAWSSLQSPDFERCYYLDAIYCNEQFYALSQPGYIIGYAIRRSSHGTDGGFYTVKMTRVAASPRFKLGFKYLENMYLVELEGELLTLSRHAVYDDHEDVYSDNNAIISSEDDDDDDNDVDDDDVFFGHSKVLADLLNQQVVCTCNHNNDHNNIDNVENDDKLVNISGSDRNSTDNDNDEGEDDGVEEDDDNEEDDKDQNSNDNDDDEGEDEDDSEEDDSDESERPRLRTDGFRILRFDAGRKRWVNVDNLGDSSLFVGYNASFSLRASDYPAGCIVPNSVYFTDDDESKLRMQSGHDMGIYNVTDRSVKPALYQIGSQSTNPSPTWVTYFPSHNAR